MCEIGYSGVQSLYVKWFAHKTVQIRIALAWYNSSGRETGKEEKDQNDLPSLPSPLLSPSMKKHKIGSKSLVFHCLISAMLRK